LLNKFCGFFKIISSSINSTWNWDSCKINSYEIIGIPHGVSEKPIYFFYLVLPCPKPNGFSLKIFNNIGRRSIDSKVLLQQKYNEFYNINGDFIQQK
jgi:hypothetical protein